MINTSIAQVGVALQDGDTLAAKPTFRHGLIGGALIKPERSVESKSVATGMRADAANASYVSEVNVGVDYETFAYADVLPLYLYGALGNIVSSPVSGKDGYYKHSITLGSVLPLLTFWGQIGKSTDATVSTVGSAKIDTLSLDFEANDPLSIGVTAAGADLTMFGTWPSSDDPDYMTGYFVPTNGVFLLDTNSQTPVEQLVTKGGFELGNNLEVNRGAGQVTPSTIDEGKLKTQVKMTIKPEDYDILRRLYTGSASGTKVTPEIVYGSAKWSFTHKTDPNMTLDVEFKNVPWNCDLPEVSPDGSGAEVELSADNVGITTPDSSPVVITVVNKVESYIKTA